LPVVKNLLLTFALLLGFSELINAQIAPIKFGTIDKADLLNTVYAADTSAPAVVLCDYGYYSGCCIQAVRVIRIKILKKEGFSWANQTYSTISKTDIRGITYNLENNEIVETKLKNESIFSPKITGSIYGTRVEMPNVKVGSVIDIQFTNLCIPNEWYFQHEIPVVHSEFYFGPCTGITFNYTIFGDIGLVVSSKNHWIAANVPAFKPEPFITSSNNYRSRIELSLETVSHPGYFQSYATLEDVRDLLIGKSVIGKALDADNYLKTTAKEILNKAFTLEDKIKLAFEYTKKIKWDQTESFFPKIRNLNICFKEGKGNSSEVNLALVQLLRKMKLDASPVVMSTRNNGSLSTGFPSINKLNYLIAAVFTENDTILLDATEANSPYYLLPMRALNGQAQIIDKSRVGWIQVDTEKKDKHMVNYRLSIEEDLSIKGKLMYSNGDYAALNFRNKYETFTSDDEYLDNFKEGKKGLEVVSHKIDNLDSLYSQLNEEFEIISSNAVSQIDNKLYIVPLLFEQIKENPFKVSERKYPIDYGYASEKTIIVNYAIPKGYSVISLPADITLKVSENIAFFSCKSSINENEISIAYKIALNRSMVLPDQYAGFREFYNQIIAKEAEPIVLKKN